MPNMDNEMRNFYRDRTFDKNVFEENYCFEVFNSFSIILVKDTLEIDSI